MKKHMGETLQRFFVTAVAVIMLIGMAAIPVRASEWVDRDQGENVTLRLYRNRAEDTTPFRVNNMFPGDAHSRSYRLEVSYQGTLTVHFHADIRSGYEKLAEVLMCRIGIQGGAPLYDGLMRDMPSSIPYILPNSGGSTESIVYDITVYLDTSVGNEYMAKELYADFRWWVEEDGTDVPTEPSTDTTEGTDPTQSTESEPPETVEPTTPGELIPPKTGDSFHLCIWFWVAMCSLLLNILLLGSRLREKKDEEAQT